MPTYTNALIRENSPYLLQHAHNPVDWHPWGEKALTKAKNENKMLIISIGYAACHWCHVMEQESFESEEVAAMMNKHFVCIKVDREERPDIDDIYMAACQLTSGRNCGWPLNSFALPDGKPVWAGTYFPKTNWLNILDQFINYQQNDPSRLQEAAISLLQGIKQLDNMVNQTTGQKLSLDVVHKLHKGFLDQIDWEKGGRSGQPKFPLPNNYEFLLTYYYHFKSEKSLEALKLTLDHMALGGIYDQLGGGFARYSVDKDWFLPHFEKMLYDNAQLISLYAKSYQFTGDQFYAGIIRETLEFIKREMTGPEGAFYSSLDADSEGEEGKFYVWDKAELNRLVLDKSELELLCKYYHISSEGNWEPLKNILHPEKRISTFASSNGLGENEVKQSLDNVKKRLFEIRNLRIRPGLDDKILTSWNGLMLEAYIQAYKALQEDEYLETAIRNAEFFRDNIMEDDFRMTRSFKNGNKKINAFLDDYAAMIQAFFSLYQVTFELEWLELAKSLADYTIAHFYDEDKSIFYYTSDLDPDLVTRKTELNDNVIPGSVSMMCNNLILLSHFYSVDVYRNIAEKLLNKMAVTLENAGIAGFYSNWMVASLKSMRPIKEVVIIGDKAIRYSREMQQQFLPNAIFVGGTRENELVLTKNRFIEAKTLIYVCENKVCKLPVENIDDALELISQ